MVHKAKFNNVGRMKSSEKFIKQPTEDNMCHMPNFWVLTILIFCFNLSSSGKFLLIPCSTELLMLNLALKI
uniref:Uncharacterized protein n=1 Tax=Rhizophora mucronata TaxID=61149 RepID=A0A2P2Q6Q5_RHIMU